MFIYKGTSIFFASLFLLSTHTSVYSSTSSNMYGKISLGYNFSHKYRDYYSGNKNELNRQSSKNKLMYGAEVGYIYSENLKLGLCYEQMGQKFNYNDMKAIRGRLIDFNSKTNIISQSLLINGYYEVTELNISAKPYITMGIGVSKNKHGKYNLRVFQSGRDGSRTLIREPSLSPKKKSNFAWNAGIGLQVPASERVLLDLGIKYYNYGKATTQGPTNSASGNIGTKIKGVIANIGLLFKF